MLSLYSGENKQQSKESRADPGTFEVALQVYCLQDGSLDDYGDSFSDIDYSLKKAIKL